MAIYRFRPILKTVLWGGERIIPYKGLDSAQHSVGESWELSGVAGDESVVAEGPEAGTTLPELIGRHRERLVGRRNYERFGNEFPLLVKFIDARDDLSIQVHPNDELARARHGSFGKTEMWYVVDAAEGAHLRSGFARETTPEQYAAAVADDTICELLCDYAVHPGDVFFLPAGRIHSIGAGSFIAEIQQTSNITYRIYDFNRRDAAGNTRELHTELAKDAIDYTVLPDYRTSYTPSDGRPTTLVDCPYFTTALTETCRPLTLPLGDADSFTVVVCVEGSGTIADGCGGETSVRRGETLLVSADARQLDIRPAERMKLLTSRVK